MLRRFLIPVVVCSFSLAADAPTYVLPEVAALRLQILQLQEDKILLERRALFDEVCRAAEIELTACNIDPVAKLVRKIEPKK